MKCHMCDKELTEKEIIWNKEIEEWDPCAVCLDIIFETAFSDGFSRPDEDDSYVIIEDDAEDRIGWHDLLYGWSSKDEDYGEGDEQ